MKLFSLLSVAVFAAATSGCITVPAAPITPSERIALDTAALNDAYGRAITDQILLNALRGRDRWPRQYVNVTGVSNTPNESQSGSLTLNPLPLNAIPGFRSSQSQLSRSESSQRAYGVQPYSTQAFNQAILNAIPRDTFEHYWSSTWSRDILMLVMVSSLQRVETPAPSASTTEALTANPRVDDAQLSRFYSDPYAQLGEGMLQGASGRHGSGTHAAQVDPHPVKPLKHGRVMPNYPIMTSASTPTGCTATPERGPVANWPDDPALAQGSRDDCAFFQIVGQLMEQGRDNVRLREAPKPKCQHAQPVAISRRNAPLITSMANAAGVSGSGLTIHAVRPENPPENFVATEVQLVHCSASDEPLVMEVLAPATDTASEDRTVIATYAMKLRSLDEMIFAMGTLLRVNNGDVHLAFRRGSDGHYQPAAPLFSAHPAVSARPVQYAAAANYRDTLYVAGPAISGFYEGDDDRTATVLTLLGQLFALNNSPGADASAPATSAVLR
ncbi:MAG: hypothetical protein QM759_08115 [Terricaulis sp.]